MYFLNVLPHILVGPSQASPSASSSYEHQEERQLAALAGHRGRVTKQLFSHCKLSAAFDSQNIFQHAISLQEIEQMRARMGQLLVQDLAKLSYFTRFCRWASSLFQQKPQAPLSVGEKRALQHRTYVAIAQDISSLDRLIGSEAENPKDSEHRRARFFILFTRLKEALNTIKDRESQLLRRLYASTGQREIDLLLRPRSSVTSQKPQSIRLQRNRLHARVLEEKQRAIERVALQFQEAVKPLKPASKPASES